MIYAISYNVFMVLCCGYAALFGGRPERWGSFIMFAASMLTTIVVLRGGGYGSVVLAIDILTLIALLILALAAKPLWTLWSAGFQLLGVATHVSVFVNAAVAPVAKAHTLVLWSYLALAALAWGTHSRIRKSVKDT